MKYLFASVYFFAILFCLLAFCGFSQEVTLTFKHTVGKDSLKLDSTRCINSKGQEFFVGKLKYYISNIVLTDISGNKLYTDTSFLIDESKSESKRFFLKNISPNNYQSVEFIVGVDSLHNSSGAQSGSLDPLNGMFWTWNSGYIFFKLEGKSSYSNLPDNLIEYHIGGYKEPHNSIRKIKLSLDSKPTKEILINADIEKLFSSEGEIDFSQTPSITTTPKAYLLADQFSRMFTVIKQE
jgi:hypothetical protein